jgi:tetratricopeptide (TPR) repeat protein
MSEPAPPREVASRRAAAGVSVVTAVCIPGIDAPAVQADPARPAGADDPDALYADRADLTRARRAVDLWRARLVADSADVEAAWKIARAAYWLGGRGAQAERRAILESGLDAARRAVALAPDRPEGHFWLAANMGALAESFGLRQGLRYRRPIKQALERVLAIDPAFQRGSADRALGRWYFRVPGLFGGSREKSLDHLRRSLEYDPTSHASLFFLAETLASMNRHREAKQALETLLAAPADPEWAPEDAEFKAKARAMLATLRPRE